MTDILESDAKTKRIIRMEAIGNRIKQERKRAGLTQENFGVILAKVLGGAEIGQNCVSDWERGITVPSVEKLIAMAQIFGCDCGYLLSDYDERSYGTTEICAATGLSEESVQTLCYQHYWEIGTNTTEVIDFLLHDCVRRDKDHHFRSVLDLLHFFLSYHGSGTMKKSVSVTGRIYDDHTNDGTVAANAISINDRIIENAVLQEIGQALISLKKLNGKGSLKHGEHSGTPG